MRGTAKELWEELDSWEVPLKGEVTIVIEGLEITEEDLKENLMNEDLTKQINIVELAVKLHDSIDMNEKEFRNLLSELFDLSHI